MPGLEIALPAQYYILEHSTMCTLVMLKLRCYRRGVDASHERRLLFCSLRLGAPLFRSVTPSAVASGDELPGSFVATTPNPTTTAHHATTPHPSAFTRDICFNPKHTKDQPG